MRKPNVEKYLGTTMVAAFLLILLLPCRALAQSTGTTVAPKDGRQNLELSMGAGAVANYGSRAGALINLRAGGPINDYLGLEAGAAALVHPFYAGAFQVNLVANLVADRWSQNQLVPFVTAGAGLSVPYPALATNFGGGAKYYFTKRWGVRFDVRDNMLTGFDFKGVYHTLEVSGGVMIRF